MLSGQVYYLFLYICVLIFCIHMSLISPLLLRIDVDFNYRQSRIALHYAISNNLFSCNT